MIPTIVTRYPATVLAAVVVLIGMAAAAGLLLATNDAGTARLALLLALIGPAVTALLGVNRGEASTHAARRADEKASATAEQLGVAITENRPTTAVALTALTRLLEATDRIEQASAKVENVANGHASGELHTRTDDPDGPANGGSHG